MCISKTDIVGAGVETDGIFASVAELPLELSQTPTVPAATRTPTVAANLVGSLMVTSLTTGIWNDTIGSSKKM